MNSPDQYQALRRRAGLLRRTGRGRLSLTGADRRAYLHGLLTNDVLALTSGTGCYAALLTPQGRMISDMRVFELGDRILLDLDVSLTAKIREHLDKFVITEDVAVEDVTEPLGQVGIYGPAAAEAVAGALARLWLVDEHPVPDAAALESLRPFENRKWGFGGEAAIVLRSGDLGVAGFDVVLPASRVAALEGALEASGAVPVTPEVTEITRVEAGIPRFLVDMDSTTIPLEAGIEEPAISMTKGCYVGQEVIVRVLHRGGGRVAKKLVSLTLSAPARRDERLFSGEREAGRITSAVESPRLGPLALGYVQRDFMDARIELRVESGATAIIRA